MKILHFNYRCIFWPKKSKTVYSGHLLMTDTFLGTACVRYRQITKIITQYYRGHLQNTCFKNANNVFTAQVNKDIKSIYND